MKKIIVALLVVVLLLGSIPSAFAADKDVNYELNTYICISNLSTQKSVQLLELDTRPNALFMKAQDAAKFSGFKVSENGGSVTYTRSTDSVTITDTISYLGVTWVPCESTLEKLQTSIKEVSDGLVITGKETTPAELYELVRTKVFGTQNGTFTGFGIEDRIGGLDSFAVKAAIFSASIHSSILEWNWFENGMQAIQELISKESFTSKYESIIHDVLAPEDGVGDVLSSLSQAKSTLKEIKGISSNVKSIVEGSFILAFSKYIDWSKFDSLSDAQEYSGIYADIAKMIKNNSGDIDTMLESKEYLEYASNYSIADLSGQAQYSEVLGKMNSAFEIPKAAKTFSAGLGYITDPVGTVLKNATGVKLKGLDLATQLSLISNVIDVYGATDVTKNQIKFTYMDDNGNITYAGVQQRLALEKFKMYCNVDNAADSVKAVMIDEAATIAYKNINGVLEDKAEDLLLGWSTAAVCKLCTTLYKLSLGQSTGAIDFFGWAAELIPMIDVQNDAKGRCYTSLINEDALRVKYTAMLYLNMYLINYAKEVKGQMDSETISVTKANDLYTVLAMIKDSDLVGVVKNSPLRKSNIMSCKKECACIVSSDPSIFENDKDVTDNNNNTSDNNTSAIPIIEGSNIADYNGGHTDKNGKSLEDIIYSLNWGNVEVTKKEYNGLHYYRYYQTDANNPNGGYRLNELIVFTDDAGRIAYIAFKSTTDVMNLKYFADMKNSKFDVAEFVYELGMLLEELDEVDKSLRDEFMFWDTNFDCDDDGEIRGYISDRSSLSFDSRTGYKLCPYHQFSIWNGEFAGWLLDPKNMSEYGYSISDFNDDNSFVNFGS